MADSTAEATSSLTLRPLPRRALPPLTSGEAASTTSMVESLNEKPTSENVTPRKKRRKRQNISASETPTESPSRSLPPISAAATTQDTLNPNTSNTSTASKTARARRRQGNRKPRKTPSPEVITNGQAITNMVNEEDVVAVEHIEDMVSMSTLPGIPGAGGANSQAQDRVYVQTTSGFKSHTDDWLASRMNKANQRSDTEDASHVTGSEEVALSFHRAFLFLTFLLHGLLAGLTVMQMSIAFVLRGPGDENFFEQYRILAQPIQSTFYILITLCLVAAMDRSNVGKLGSDFFINLCKVEATAWTVVVYFIAFGMNVGISGFDFWLGRGTIVATTVTGGTNSTTLNFDDLNATSTSSLTTWTVLNVLRCVFVVIGWLLIALSPNTDATLAQLFAPSSEEQQQQ
nr:transmembrane protein 237 isoform X1 [Ciona intestinalis]|eukprot:XP_002130665.1 transmembrane protein 237 isoform X1 [Ciona intestinalis]